MGLETATECHTSSTSCWTNAVQVSHHSVLGANKHPGSLPQDIWRAQNCSQWICSFLTSFNIRITPERQQIWFTATQEAQKVHKHSNIMNTLCSQWHQGSGSQPHILSLSMLGQQGTCFHILYPQLSLLLETACCLGVLIQHLIQAIRWITKIRHRAWIQVILGQGTQSGDLQVPIYSYWSDLCSVILQLWTSLYSTFI